MILWAVILGDDHPFTLAYGSFLQSYSAREYSYQTRLKALDTSAPLPALLLRYVQLRMVTYWRKAVNYRSLPPPPNFEEVLDKLEMHDRNWIPQLPYKYWKPLVKPIPDGSLSGSTTVSGLTAASTSRGSGGGGGITSGPSGSGKSLDRSKQTPAKSPAVAACFAPYTEHIQATTIKAAMTKGGTPPTVERNGRAQPVCLSYHLKGECWSGCARADDHGPHTQEEDNALLNWCQAAYS
jgi:hypothetical protein